MRLEFDEKLEVVDCDIGNIIETCPTLLKHQHNNVLRIEKRFLAGKGYLCTDGTGSGKTFTGLGVAKRFYLKDKKRILIVVPTDAKCEDWIEDGAKVGLYITKLEGVSDRGQDVRVTTYANFYQNDALLKTLFDLVIYDESHYLNQNSKGSETRCLEKHRMVANVQSAALKRGRKKYGSEKPQNVRDFGYMQNFRIWEHKVKEYAKQLYDHTKVLFLSATPFAYHKSIIYADGCLFDIEESFSPKAKTGIYNDPGPWEKFMIEHFGYRMKTNKLTEPEHTVNVGLLEREFFEKYSKLGVMSTNILDVPFDYSRSFIKVSDNLGNKIDEGYDLQYDPDFQKRYPILSKRMKYRLNYITFNQILECIKVRQIESRIRAHLTLGRKVVIFHSFNHARIDHPFQFTDDILFEDEKHKSYKLNEEINNFKKEYSQYWNLDIGNLVNVREYISERFPNSRQFNGTVPKKKRNQFIKEFNKDYSDADIIVVQSKSGREGISLHDITGKQQRVAINLGLPVEPSSAIQLEGRIYRHGNMSNAIYEYIVLHTNTERFAFVDKISKRARTVENMAMGNLARNLEHAFMEGYMEYVMNTPNISQGRWGKKADRESFVQSDFERAKTYYYKKAKKTSQNKSSEGVDFFATPEPLGYKMNMWANTDALETVLEPSCGDGAISRWFPSNAKTIGIEQSIELASLSNMNSPCKVIVSDFLEYNIVNKFDAILMNPPFGHGGKDAIEHLTKALLHISPMKNGEIYAIIPEGNSTQKHFNGLMESKNFQKRFSVHWEMKLPSCTFKRAGTSVMTRLVCISTYVNHAGYRTFDFTHCKDEEEFFNAIEHFEVNPKTQ